MKKNCFYILFLISVFTLFSFRSKHPFHVGSVEFRHNAKEKSMEITGKFFYDDFENAIRKNSGKKVFLTADNINTQHKALIENYCRQVLALKINQKNQAITYLGAEIDKESVLVYLEAVNVPEPKSVEASVTFLYNLFSDQMNIIHIISKNQRKSFKLIYPDKTAIAEF